MDIESTILPYISKVQGCKYLTNNTNDEFDNELIMKVNTLKYKLNHF